MIRIGLDVGSTTLKCVALDDADQILYKQYERHFSRIAEKASAMLSELTAALPQCETASLVISGSAGMGLADSLGIPFSQEVYATRVAIRHNLPDTDVVIELGGEDAKILFFTGGVEVRMNGSCAGGTGAFIDQMASLLQVDAADMNALAAQSEKLYTIASRCGVFAKSDVQPLLNQGARKTDVCASILQAVVNQTVAGLAQGRTIGGKVVYLGGPLSFLSELRSAFDRTLGVTGVCPADALYYVAIGAALCAVDPPVSIPSLAARIAAYSAQGGYIACRPLFTDEAEYEAFRERHAQYSAPYADGAAAERVYLGLDAGSTTVKGVVTDEDGAILFTRYLPNNGNPIPIVRDFLTDFYQQFPRARICGSAVTGYGEDIVRSAFGVDCGLVETMAHFTAAKRFRPNVDFIIDIGGQDIKCFKIRGRAIDNIFLNEACSSGCGSFLQTFAGAWGYSIADFAKLGLFADKPVDLGSRCTVFMNSSVKQAQKDGASLENISAGLSISVVKNALYKVIRAANADDLGQNIVVQGGTFLNDAVLRAFEQEIGRDVVRPDISGLMGAYGAALYARTHAPEHSTILTPDALEQFTHDVRVTTCQGCTNHCRLTINTFPGGRRFIGGNRCSKPVTGKQTAEIYNLYDYKRSLLEQYRTGGENKRGRIGLPMGLNFYELLPFWHTFFTSLGFETVVSPESTRQLYLDGQYSIPSDTVCYPAKLMHGHIEYLLRQNVDAIFYPCMTYNVDERLGDNHYNCPVVAYYPEVLHANVQSLKDVTFIHDYLGLHHPKYFARRMRDILSRQFGVIPLSQINAAAKQAYRAYHAHMKDLRKKGEEFLRIAGEKNLPVIILCGRPYHVDPEISHGIDRLICECGAVVVTEDSVSQKIRHFPTAVLDQWTYHSRLYAAAKYVAESGNERINLVQLVSFGCGVDAITTDEVRRILEQKDRIYTQIKIDEIANLGAVRIRLRSLFAATEQ